jgi:hypothetical protein
MRPKVQLQVRNIILRKQQLDITVFISDQREFCVRFVYFQASSLTRSLYQRKLVHCKS